MKRLYRLVRWITGALVLLVAALILVGTLTASRYLSDLAAAIVTGIIVGLIVLGAQYIVDRRRDYQEASTGWAKLRPRVLKNMIRSMAPEYLVGNLNAAVTQLRPLSEATMDAPLGRWAQILDSDEIRDLDIVVSRFPSIELAAGEIEAALSRRATTENAGDDVQKGLSFTRWILLAGAKSAEYVAGPDGLPALRDFYDRQITRSKLHMVAEAFTPVYLEAKDAYDRLLTATDDDIREGVRYLHH